MTENTSETAATDEARTATDETRTATDGGAASAHPTSEGPTALTDPTALCEREGVRAVERTYTHEEADHCEREAAGRAIVGVTNDAGELLLLVNEDIPHVTMPNELVEPGGDWAAADREYVAGVLDADVVLEGVECVRTVEHRVESESESEHESEFGCEEGPQMTTHHVLLSASVAPGESTDPRVDVCDDEWTAGWHDEVPVDLAEASDVADDIAVFLD